MTLDEAIKILEEYNPCGYAYEYDTLWKALELGIVALKHERDVRSMSMPMVFTSLPDQVRTGPPDLLQRS